MTFDETLSKIGGFGRYQKLLILGFIIFVPGCNWQFICINFLAGDMDHWCKIDAEGVNKSHLKDLIIPNSDEFGEKVYSKCDMYDINMTEIGQRAGYMLVQAQNWTRRPCENGWEFDQTEFYSTIVSQYALVCDRAWLRTIPAMTYVLGVSVGSIPAGFMSDRWGRKWTAIFMIIAQMVCNVGEAFSPYFWMFVALRFLVGIWNVGAYAALWIHLIESMSPVYRNHCTYICTLGRILEFILPIIAYFVRNHMYLQIVSVGMALPGLIFAILLPESPRWLLHQKRYEDYLSVVRKIAVVNKVIYSEDTVIEKSETTRKTENDVKVGLSFLKLFKTPRLRQRTLILWFLWFTMSFVLYAFGTNIGKLVPGSIYLNMILVTAGSEIPTFLTMWIALFKSGRRLAIMANVSISGFCCLLIIPLIMVNMELLVTIAAMIAMSTVKTMMRILFLYTGELYPTPVRQIAFGSASSIGRIAALIATQITHLKNIWFGLPYVLLSVFPIVSSVLAYFLPETRGCHLPETFEEAETFGTPEYHNKDKEYGRNGAEHLKEPLVDDGASSTIQSNKNNTNA